jgi:ABC-2 type transport system ATP-binding protein
VVLTTHYMDEAEHLADRVGIVVQGRLVAVGTPAELGARFAAQTIVSFRLPDELVVDQLPDLGGPLVSQGLDIQVRTTQLTTTLYRLTDFAVGHGVNLPELSVTRPSLEDVYLELVGAAPVSAQAPRGEPVPT